MSQGWQGQPGGYGPPQGQPGGFGPPGGYGPPQGPPGGYGPPPPKSGMSGGVIALIVVGVLVVVIGMFAVIAISGVKRYLSSAKSAEAKNTVMAIAREAERAYDNEPHHLCGSAKPVPAEVPKAKKYMASSSDYDTGSETEGWKCLKHASTGSSYYQYEYRVGGDYKGTSRGAPDPGSDGFEVSAEGDLDGDGETSLFVVTGKVDPTTHKVTISPQIFISEEQE